MKNKIDIIKSNFIQAEGYLSSFINESDNFIKIENAANLIISAFNDNKKIISCGNGGSMCDAMHLAQELSGNFKFKRRPLPAIAISDPAYMSCVLNDYDSELIFSRFIQSIGQSGDVLFAISTSGNSKNIIRAAEIARKKKIKIISLTGNNGGDLAKFSDIEIRVNQDSFSDRIQEIHIKIIHSIVNYIEINMNL